MFTLREVEIEDPWLEYIDKKKATPPKKLIVENIFFESDKYLIGPQAKEILNKVVLVMKTNTKLKIEIGAHTDSKGTPEENLKLSASRAKTVMEYLVAAGISPAKLVCKGYGEKELLNDCNDTKPCTELEHAKNRRIEFKIIEE
jgi:outer membrane protein OmpA-like peptidoglycan-associated protein